MTKEEIDRIKREVDLVGLVRERGIELTKKGADFVGLCPFHPDTQPSLVITPSKNLFHCLGCGRGGSNLDFVMEHDQVSFRHALSKLGGNGDQTGMTHPALKKSPDAVAQHKVLERVVAYYHQTLLNEPKAQEYLRQRGIYLAEAVDTFSIGYANRTLSAVVSPSNPLRTTLQDIGIFNQKTGHELFTGSIVVPIIALDGRVR